MSSHDLNWLGCLKELGSISLAGPTCKRAYFRQALQRIAKTFGTDRSVSLCVDTPDESFSYPPGSQPDFYQPSAMTRPLGGGFDFHIALDNAKTTAADWDETEHTFLDLIVQQLSHAVDYFESHEALALYQKIYRHSYEGVMISDADNRITEVNPAFTRITGYKPEEVIGRNPRILSSGRQGDDFYQRMWQTLGERGVWRGEVWNRRKNGEIYSETLTVIRVSDLDGETSHYVGVFTDISQLKEQEAQLEHLAYYDVLTGLPNRRLLSQKLVEYMRQARHDGFGLVVVYLDIDGFKWINDQYGEDTGNRLLVAISQRLQLFLNKNEVLARMGGDEFVLLLSQENPGEYDDHGNNNLRLPALIAALNKPFAIDHRKIKITASLGVTRYPDDHSDADQLIRHADQAMYKAKLAGKSALRWFELESHQQARYRFSQRRELEVALRENQFVLFYQPKVDISNGRVLGVEALLRWAHPKRGLLAPGMFINHVFESDLELPLGWWVIEQALRQITQWRQHNHELAISVNVSGKHLLSEHFTAKLKRLLDDYPQAPAHLLELEILESGALLDVVRAQKNILETRKLGVQFSLDDFGTGYSSLSYLRRLPVDTLKIDQSFVRNMLEDPADFGIVEGVISLGRSFNRQVIAEGVETLEHASILQDMGCNLVQGYGFAHPMPVEHFESWFKQWQESPLGQGFDPKVSYRPDLPLKIAGMSLRVWVERVIAYVEGDEANAPELDPRFCPFGDWYHGSGAGRFGDLESFDQLGRVHERIHAKAVKLAHLVNTGRRDKACSKIPSLCRLRDELLDCIDQLIADVYLNPKPGQENQDAT